MSHFLKRSVYFLFVLLVAIPTLGVAVPVEFDAGRNRLIAYMLNHQLPAQHYGHKGLNDELSKSAFEIYLRQLDPRRRFFLKADIEQLDAFAVHIDDALARGRIVLPDAAADLLGERIKEVRQEVTALFKEGFDVQKEDFLETDPEKLEYAVKEQERKDRWRRMLKMQVIDTYLNAQQASINSQNLAKEEKERKSENLSEEQQWQKAYDSVQKRTMQLLDRLQKETRQDYYNRYFDAVARAFDPHTSYMAPTSKEDFDIHMSGSLEGIGALLREDDGHIKVVRIIPGSAAERQGELQAEDTILAVAEKEGEPVEISSMRIRDAVTYIRGPKGTEVRLTVEKPDGTQKVVAIVRDVVQIEETYVKSVMLEGKSGEKIGYIKIPSFYRDFEKSRNGENPRNVTSDTREAIEKLKGEGMRSLVLDLRNNGGGSLKDAVDISGLFLPGGPVVQVKNSQGMIRVLEDEDAAVAYSGPMIVLVNKFSASASEILAAALQDYGRALIVGANHTHGKGTVQALLDMNQNLPLLHLKKYDDLGALKVTIQKFYRVNGKSTQFKGVEPDIVIPTAFDYLESGEQYLDYALPWDQVQDVGYSPWDGQRIDRSIARSQADQWVAGSEDFGKIKKEGDLFKQRKENTNIKVSLSALRKEREKSRGISGNNGEEVDPDHALAMSKTAQKEEVSLEEQLGDDPWIKMSLYLLQQQDVAEQTALRVQ